jgi:hypothetical protein
MAGRGGPSFLKRQKEQARTARANAKRADRQARRDQRGLGGNDNDIVDLDTLMEGTPPDVSNDEDGQAPAPADLVEKPPSRG